MGQSVYVPGIMDQSAILVSEAGKLTVTDCVAVLASVSWQEYQGCFLSLGGLAMGLGA